MGRMIGFILIIFLLSGCSMMPRIKTETVEIKTPILHCPMPPAGVLERPQLPIDSIKPGDEIDPGGVVQKYKASVRALQNYSIILENTVRQYESYSKDYKQLEAELQRFMKTEEDKEELKEKPDDLL